MNQEKFSVKNKFLCKRDRERKNCTINRGFKRNSSYPVHGVVDCNLLSVP